MTAQAVFQQAVSLHQAGKLADAERLYGAVLAADPRHYPAQYQLAFLLYQQQRQPDALRAVDAALALNPDAGEALVLQSAVLLSAGMHDQALASVSKAVARDPADAEAWLNRGVILAALRRLDDAVESYDRALAIRPTPEAWINRGAALLALMRWEDAVRSFDQALVRAPRSYEAWRDRGSALYKMERFVEALESYETAVQLRPNHAAAWTNRGKALNGLARFDEALASYDKALALAPASVDAWYARALGLRTLHRFEEALASVDRALAIRGDSTASLILRGWLLCELHRIGEGLAAITQAARDSNATDTAAPSVHRLHHDVQQRDYLASQGVVLADGDHHLADGDKLAQPAVNPGNAASAAAAWDKSRPRMVVIDDFLSDEALEKLRRFCWGSTVWRTSYDSGYLGATPEHGFACPLLAQIAEELRATFPTVIGNHPLRMLWGFKYDGHLRGTGIHADQAAVNVNFWITPDAANRNPARGGMVIWDVAAPRDWDLRTYNGDEAAVRAFLERSGAKPVAVPYRANRAVIFDSDLFHETDALDFKAGYLDRRINLTLLYGRRTYYGD